MSPRTKALLAIVGASLLWSTAGITKIPLRVVDPFWLGFYRFLIASVIILPFFLKNKTHSVRSLLSLVPLATLTTINVVLFYIGLSRTTANASSLIYSVIPLTVAILAYKMIGEQLTRKKLLGILIGFAGVALIVVLPAFEQGQRVSGDLGGNLIILLATLAWAIYTVGSRHAIATRRYSPVEITGVSLFTSLILFSMLALFRLDSYSFAALAQPGVALIILHLGVLLTVATFLLYQWGIQNSSATTASLKQYVEPVFSVLFNMIVLGEIITSGFLVGSALVLVGITLTSGTSILRELAAVVKRRG